MIQFVVTGAHAYTHERLTKVRGLDFRILSYNRALRAATLPRATYIFSDMDRLGFYELELAARLYRLLAAAGLRVLNDPARVAQRVPLLRILKCAGFNDFDVFRVGEDGPPRRFPVFLRTQSAHRGPLSDLLHTQDEVDGAVDAALANGFPAKELVLVEYCAEPIRPGLFRKLSVYRVGDALVPSTFVHESKWSAKRGELGVADAALYADEHAAVHENRFAEPLRPAFTLAHVEYGRADFGVVSGRPQVYEINTNPMLSPVAPHPSPLRVEAAQHCERHFEEALQAIDTPATGRPVAIDDAVLVRQRRVNRWMSFARWMP